MTQRIVGTDKVSKEESDSKDSTQPRSKVPNCCKVEKKAASKRSIFFAPSWFRFKSFKLPNMGTIFKFKVIRNWEETAQTSRI